MTQHSRQRGRPRKDAALDLKQIERFGKLGLTDAEIGFALDVDERTVTRWKNQNPAFLSALQKGKTVADANVVDSLYKRATGIAWNESTTERNRHGQMVVTKIVTKYIPPSELACNSWLNNRQRDRWTWNPRPDAGVPPEQRDKLLKLLASLADDES
jgi:hypothetical protein